MDPYHLEADEVLDDSEHVRLPTTLSPERTIPKMSLGNQPRGVRKLLASC